MVYVKLTRNFNEEWYVTQVVWGVRVEAENLARFLLKGVRTETDFLAQEFDPETTLEDLVVRLEGEDNYDQRLFRSGVAEIRDRVTDWVTVWDPDWDPEDDSSRNVIFGFRVADIDERFDVLDEYSDRVSLPDDLLSYNFTKLANSTRPECLDVWTLPYEAQMREFFNAPLEIHVGMVYCSP